MAAPNINGYPNHEWRASLRRASFRGVPFYVQQNTKQSGRRTATHEAPKNDIPYSEDMGRRLYRFMVIGYIVGPHYFSGGSDAAGNPSPGTFAKDRDNIEAALEDRKSEGPGVLVLPTRGQVGVISNLFTCLQYTTLEKELWGGYAEIEMFFQEYGSPNLAAPIFVSPPDVLGAAKGAGDAAVALAAAKITPATPLPFGGT
jgi:hypothetical protein